MLGALLHLVSDKSSLHSLLGQSFLSQPKVYIVLEGENWKSMRRVLTATRWWSKYEVMRKLMDLFANVEPLLETYTDISPATLLSMLRDEQEKKYLMVELAVTMLPLHYSQFRRR